MLLPVCERQNEKYDRGSEHIHKGVENGSRRLNRDFVERRTDGGTYDASQHKKHREVVLLLFSCTNVRKEKVRCRDGSDDAYRARHTRKFLQQKERWHDIENGEQRRNGRHLRQIPFADRTVEEIILHRIQNDPDDDERPPEIQRECEDILRDREKQEKYQCRRH